MNRYKRTLTSLLSCPEKFSQITAAACFVAILVALTRVIAQPSVPIVHAYTSENKQSGATLFHEKGCEHCHGVDGRGGDLGPDLGTVGKRLNKQQIEHQIREGGSAMPAFRDVLQPEEIKDLVDFLHAKRKVPKQKPLPTGKSSPATQE
jgi:mono/diheme cytochrome c family protein